ncbi:MAG: PAS domain S-box protein, partial [Chromatiaceae bacterium]|nr:PAS domain S-box protein [Chromatiaceae bacterium]
LVLGASLAWASVAPAILNEPLTWTLVWARHQHELLFIGALFALLAGFLSLLAISNARLRAARRAVIASEQRWLMALDVAGHGVWDWDAQTDRVFYSECWKRTLGYADADISSSFDEWRQRVHPDDLPQALEQLERHLRGETPSFSVMHRMMGKDGRYRWILGQGLVIERDPQGRARRMVGTNTDVTPYREAEAALKEREALFSAVIDQALDGILLIDPSNGALVRFNRAAHEQLGYSEAEFAQLAVSKIEADHSPEEQQAHMRLIEREGAAIFDSRHRHKDGHLRDVRVSACRIRQDGRSLIAVILKDLTDLRDAERGQARQRQQFRVTFEQAAVGMAQIAPDGALLRVNAKLGEMLGFKGAQLVGSSILSLTHPEDLPLQQARLDDLLRGDCGSFAIEKRCRHRDGRWIWLLMTLSLARDAQGAPDYFISVCEDIGERKRAEEARLRALAEAERLAALKNAFLANMSHEIRTPLNAILGLVHIGRREHDTDSAGTLFRRIEQAGQHLLGLLNDVLDYSRIEAGKLGILTEPFRLADCLAEVQSIISPQASAKSLSLRIELAPSLPEWVRGDALRLRQILINLLGNAVKFTPTGEIGLRVTRAGEALSFVVHDTGIGMSEAQIGRIFLPFEQADSGITRLHGGSGLGLTISLNLARMMNGSLNVESRPGEGSTFELVLPLAETAPPEGAGDAAEPGAERRRLAGLRVLAVDDVEINRLVLSDLLEHEGAEVLSVASGAAALERLAAPGTAIDLVLMDIQMPGMDGFEATRRILQTHPEQAVIGLTAHALPEDRTRCLEAGMLDHLGKPIDVEQLVQSLRRWSQQAARADERGGEGAERPALAMLGATSAIDWGALSARFHHNPGLIEQLIAVARDSQAETPARLRQLAATGDVEGLYRLAHAIKGIAANLCADALRDLAQALCERTRGGELEALNEAESLAQAVEQLLEALAGKTGSRSDP